jgi:hypothetical protein
VAAEVFFDWKHSRQNTGRPCVGLKGTVVSFSQPEQIARVSTLLYPAAGKPSACARFPLHALQRLGSFLNCLSWKKSCSPAVKTKSSPQSTHFRLLSWNSMQCPFQPEYPDHDTPFAAAVGQIFPGRFRGYAPSPTCIVTNFFVRPLHVISVEYKCV